MATLTNPVDGQNIVDRFEDFVTNYANGAIVWYDTNKPFASFPSSYLGSSSIAGSISDIPNAGSNDVITALTIYNTLVAETNRFTSVRSLRARERIAELGSGNETVPDATGTIKQDVTNIANMNSSYLQDIGSPANAGVASGQVVDASNLEDFFQNLQDALITAAGNQVSIIHDICHSSCHSSCHQSRGRR